MSLPVKVNELHVLIVNLSKDSMHLYNLEHLRIVLIVDFTIELFARKEPFLFLDLACSHQNQNCGMQLWPLCCYLILLE